MFFWFSLDYFVLVLFAFVVLSLVSPVLRQEIGWEERLRNDLFCVEWDVKPEVNQSAFVVNTVSFAERLLRHGRQCHKAVNTACDLGRYINLYCTAD